MDKALKQLRNELSKLETLGFTEKGVKQINLTIEEYENLPDDKLEEAKIYFYPYMKVLEKLTLKRLNTSVGTIETSISITRGYYQAFVNLYDNGILSMEQYPSVKRLHNANLIMKFGERLEGLEHLETWEKAVDKSHVICADQELDKNIEQLEGLIKKLSL